MRVGAEVNIRGSLFDGSLTRAVARACEESRSEVGDYGVDQVRQRFDRVLRHDAPAYRTGRRTPGTLRAAVQAHYEGDRVTVGNGDVIYQWWIEGVGSRNRTTRFKGYFTFRKVTQLVRAEAPNITRRIIGRAVRQHT
jgi:hypothetical protein